MTRYEQYPEDPRLADPEYAERALRGDWTFMSQREEEEFLSAFGSRKERKAIKARRKALKKADKPS
ncbi:hypothetical protein H7J51_24970 [Mycobacterium crocinum]|uniref:Uncharacterized protein n=1 Tax=Mycolicibacterium crocinum TaxID=388459 RepID=A0ABY3TRB6_9MYCO|nr:hypothetical protein [Mycolicibacterium crocinum]MCV7218516.1 hypothetical protein [Mycolicibacterium crocinum]ULN43980.1 hypothetical protein MI149_13475 [Mycolicibacterium crocinum]